MEWVLSHSCASSSAGLFPRKRESRQYGIPLLSGFPLSREGHPSDGFSFTSAGLPRAGGEAGCFIRLKSYTGSNSQDVVFCLRSPSRGKAEQPHRLDYFQKGRILLRAEAFLAPAVSLSASGDFSGGVVKAAASSTMACVMAAFGACCSRGTPLFRAAIMVR